MGNTTGEHGRDLGGLPACLGLNPCFSPWLPRPGPVQGTPCSPCAPPSRPTNRQRGGRPTAARRPTPVASCLRIQRSPTASNNSCAAQLTSPAAQPQPSPALPHAPPPSTHMTMAPSRAPVSTRGPPSVVVPSAVMEAGGSCARQLPLALAAPPACPGPGGGDRPAAQQCAPQSGILQYRALPSCLRCEEGAVLSQLVQEVGAQRRQTQAPWVRAPVSVAATAAREDRLPACARCVHLVRVTPRALHPDACNYLPRALKTMTVPPGTCHSTRVSLPTRSVKHHDGALVGGPHRGLEPPAERVERRNLHVARHDG